MQLKKSNLILVIFLSITALLLIVYFALFGKMTVVQDESWKMIVPKGYYLNLRIRLAESGYRLSVKTISSDKYQFQDLLLNELHKTDGGKVILCTPVITAAIRYQETDVRNELNAKIVGIGAEESELFDLMLASNAVNGWKEAAEKTPVAGENTAVVYDNDSIIEAKTVFDVLNSEEVLNINVDDYGKLFSAEVSMMLNENKTTLVFCPHIESMSDLFSSDSTVKIITDYRYADVARSARVVGIVVPDLFSALTSDETDFGYLNYEYRKVR